MKKKIQKRPYYRRLAFLFTNGQSYYFNSLFGSAHTFVWLKIDFFSNKLWQTLDEPKMFANLVRFERRYGVTTPTV